MVYVHIESNPHPTPNRTIVTINFNYHHSMFLKWEQCVFSLIPVELFVCVIDEWNATLYCSDLRDESGFQGNAYEREGEWGWEREG